MQRWVWVRIYVADGVRGVGVEFGCGFMLGRCRV